jgi:hypothetical protein
VSSVAVVEAELLIAGALFTAVIVTVVDCVADKFGVPPSVTRMATTQLAGGTGPVGVNVKTPVPGLIDPAQV